MLVTVKVKCVLKSTLHMYEQNLGLSLYTDHPCHVVCHLK